MNNNLSLYNISHYSTLLIHELKYQVKSNEKKYLLQTAKEVEGVFIHILLKNMRNSLSKDNLFDNDQSRLYTDIYDQQISKEVTNKGIGLAKIILQQIEKNQN